MVTEQKHFTKSRETREFSMNFGSLIIHIGKESFQNISTEIVAIYFG